MFACLVDYFRAWLSCYDTFMHRNDRFLPLLAVCVCVCVRACVRADVVLLARLCPDFRGRRVHQMAGAHPNRGESTDTTIIYPPQKTKRERKYPPSHFNI